MTYIYMIFVMQERRQSVLQYGLCVRLAATCLVRASSMHYSSCAYRHQLHLSEEFRAIRADHDFFELCRTPDLATEVTIQPIRRYRGLLDAAIIFSDILVVPQAMGMEVLMNPAPSFPDPLNTPEDVHKLRKVVDVNKELGYVFEAITRTRTELGGEVPLIGFSGAPWTLFSYMVEGGGSKTYQKSKTWLFKYPEETKALFMRIADVCVDYLIGQVKAGAQVNPAKIDA
jgi:uroporphyrinogen decarboxylase